MLLEYSNVVNGLTIAEISYHIYIDSDVVAVVASMCDYVHQQCICSTFPVEDESQNWYTVRCYVLTTNCEERSKEVLFLILW